MEKYLNIWLNIGVNQKNSLQRKSQVEICEL